MAWSSYSLNVIPQWCTMPFRDHFDGYGGCWGIYHGNVEKLGEGHCRTCEYHHANRNKSERELQEMRFTSLQMEALG